MYNVTVHMLYQCREVNQRIRVELLNYSEKVYNALPSIASLAKKKHTHTNQQNKTKHSERVLKNLRLLLFKQQTNCIYNQFNDRWWSTVTSEFFYIMNIQRIDGLPCCIKQRVDLKKSK